MEIEDLGEYHWSILLTKGFSYFYGTIVPSLPYGEKFLLNRNKSKILQLLKENGVRKSFLTFDLFLAVGHGAGTGEDLNQVISKL